jgi:PAS domain S-box-containing protein
MNLRGNHRAIRLRQVGPVALVLALTVAGFVEARALARSDIRNDANRRADVAAAQIRGRMEHAASLTESLRRFMIDAGGTGVTSDQFARNALRWLSPASFPAAAWVERVPAASRAAYQARLRQPIVTPDVTHSVVPAGARSSYVAATLVSGFSPLDLPGIDLGRERGMAAALVRSTRLDRVVATQLSGPGPRTKGLYLVAPASNLVAGTLRPGHVVLFVPEDTLRDAARDAPSVQITTGGPADGRSKGARRTFSASGQSFDVVVPRGSAHGAGALLPWIVLTGGLVLAVLAAALGLIAARRARAKEELDRIFTLSPDLIAVADFDGHFTRVNPAASEILGYSEGELLERPYLDLVHPDDRSRTAAEAAAITEGKTAHSFENRYVRKDGSERVLEWTTKPLVKERVMYGVARDVTGRRQAETEEAALRRIATLAAEGVESEELFAVVAEEVARVVDVPLVRVMRYERDGTALRVGSFAADGEHFPFDERASLEGQSVLRIVRETAKPARIEDFAELEGEIAETARTKGIRSAAGCPILVAGRLWGAIVASSREVLPKDTEHRLADFTQLLAGAIGNVESRQALEGLAAEQAALRRVATLAAEGATQPEIFESAARAIVHVFEVSMVSIDRYESDSSSVVIASNVPGFAVGSRWPLDGPSLGAAVLETGSPARIDDYSGLHSTPAAAMRKASMKSAVGVPILVDGRPWGFIAVGTTGNVPLPEDTEERLADFTEILAVAIARADARDSLALLAEEQAALRRVATLVAEGTPPPDLFQAVVEEVAGLFPVGSATMGRYEPDNTATTVASWAPGEPVFPTGRNWPIVEGKNATWLVHRTGQAARIDDFSAAVDPIGAVARDAGLTSAVGSPIVVEGHLWGVMAAHSSEGPLPPGAEARLASFTELVATAIANAESRDALEVLADEQAALGRVATLVAEGAEPAELFSVVTDEAGGVLGSDVAAVVRFDQDDPGIVFVGVSKRIEALGSGPVLPHRWDINDDSLAAADVFRSGRSARVEARDWSTLTGPIADVARSFRVVSSVACPIVVEGRPWGAISVSSTDEPLPLDTEARLEKFTELVATAIANAESQGALRRLVDEQATLRRVATMVAEGVQPATILAAVTEDVAAIFGSMAAVVRFEEDGATVTVGVSQAKHTVGTRWEPEEGRASAEVYRTGRSARFDAAEGSPGGTLPAGRPPSPGLLSSVASPIVVEGRLWGTLLIASREEVLPLDSEKRLERFTGLVATAIANAESRGALAELADEQAALRRVATLVARSAQPAEIFSAVSDEVGALFGTDTAGVVRFEREDEAIVFVGVSKHVKEVIPLGTRWPLEEALASDQVYRTGRSARVEQIDWSEVGGNVGPAGRRLGVASTVASPITVEGRLWGAATISAHERLPDGTEARLAQFADLVATAMANADARGAVQRLAEEQAGLRRVATLVATGVPPSQIFTAVSREVERVFDLDPEGPDRATVVRFDPGPECVLVGAAKEDPEEPLGLRWAPKKLFVSTNVLETGRSARIDEQDVEAAGGPEAEALRRRGQLCQVGSPIVVANELWGAVTLNTREPLPPDTEQRLEEFTELVATAIANAESREAIAELADEQAALRRLATLIAEGASPAETFFVVSQEIQQLFGVEVGTVGRFDPGPEFVVVGVGEHVAGIPLGSRWKANDLFVTTKVFRTGRSARVDPNDLNAAGGPVAESLRRQGHVSQLASPIVVEGQLWGAVTLTAKEKLPADTERRLEKFAELVAIAIANAESKSELTASRRRIVAASDEARRRIERDLHDGTQQRLVSIALAVSAVEASIPPERDDLREELSAIAGELGDALKDLQELSRGIHSTILSRGGLEPALRTLARRAPIPIKIDVDLEDRLPQAIESAAYFVAAEALANATKHAHASRIEVSLTSRESSIVMSVRDDGIGGVDPTRGSGVLGLTDRLEALGGSIHIQSRAGEGTEITAELPLELEEVG